MYTHLVQSHVGDPDIVLLVHGDHMGQEEQVLAPRVDDVAGGVNCQYGGLGDGHGLVQAVSVVAESRSLSTC